MGDSTKGVLAMAAACTIWGLSPLFYALLSHIPPMEVLAHRTLWSLVIFAGILALQGRLAELPAALSTRRRFLLVALSTAMISVNWFLFIYAVGVGRTVEASLGYYIYPLVAVAIGAVVLREGLGALQAVAVALAAGAVLYPDGRAGRAAVDLAHACHDLRRLRASETLGYGQGRSSRSPRRCCCFPCRWPWLPDFWLASEGGLNLVAQWT